MAGAAATAFAALAGAGMIVVKAFMKAVEAVVHPEFLALHQQHENLTGHFLSSQEEQDEEFYTELSELRGRVDELAENFLWLKRELKPNSGTSLRDAIDRIESRLAASQENSSEV
jgi:predicted nuclease with TOPRIM domain